MEELGFHRKGLYKGSKLHGTYHHSQPSHTCHSCHPGPKALNTLD